MNNARTLRLLATVSGSFRRHMRQIADDVVALTDRDVEVLSPSEPRVVDAFGDFLFVASDIHRNVRLLQARHLDAVRNSAFLWVTCPDGEVGVSTAMEIGAATAFGVPVHAITPPNDLTLRQLVSCVGSVDDAVDMYRMADRRPSRVSLLLEPAFGADTLHRVADQLQRRLQRPDLTPTTSDPLVAALAAQGRDVFYGM